MSCRLLKYYNEAHLGDCVFHAHYLNKLLTVNTKFEAVFYLNQTYFDEVNTLLYDEIRSRVILADISLKSSDAENCWIGRDRYYYSHPNKEKYDKFYVEWFNYLSNITGVDNPIKSHKDLLIDHPAILNPNPLSGKYDFLFINSVPKSNQYNYSKAEWDQLIIELSQNYKCITTLKVNNSIPCTLDCNLSLLDIGNLATTTDYIIAIHTAPIICTFNIWSIDRVKKWIVFDKTNTFSFNENIHLAKTLSDINWILEIN